MKKTFPIVLIALVVWLAACAPKAVAPLPEREPLAADGVQEYGGAPLATAASPGSAGVQEAPAGLPVLERRMVIKNADLQLVVTEVQGKMNAIAQLAEREGGFVLSTRLYQASATTGATVPEASISIRVPSDRFDTLVAEIEDGAVEVLQDDRSGQDVTAQYVDLQARLKARQAAAARLEQLLQQASDTESVLDIFQELESVNAEIESLKGQIQYYEEASNYSLINVTLIAEEKVQPIQVGRWQPKGTVNKAIQSLIKFLRGFVDFLIWFVLFVLPVSLLIFGPPALIIWAIVRAARREKARTPPKAGG